MNEKPKDKDSVEEPKVEVLTSTAMAPPAAHDGMIATSGAGPRDPYPLARLDDTQFADLLKSMSSHFERLKQIQRNSMKPGVHYGIPGKKAGEKIELRDGQKVGLFKAGQELLLKLHRYVADVTLTVTYGDPENATSPAIRVDAVSRIHADSLEGPVIATGVGSCNTWETKYRWRHAQKKCPNCGEAKLRFQREAKGGQYKGQSAHWCAPNRDGSAGGGCGAEFAGNDPRIETQEAGRVTNAEPFDLENTIVKMAAKRAKVDATIAATGASDLFTQDIEDMSPADRERLDREADEAADKFYGTTSEKTATNGDAKLAPGDRFDDGKGGVQTVTKADIASDKQVNLVRVLLKKKHGATNDREMDAALREHHAIGVGLAGLTKVLASRAIATLNDRPDVAAKPAAPTSPAGTAAAAMVPDDEKTRLQFREAIMAVVGQLHGVHPERTIIQDRGPGVPHVVDPESLVAMGFDGGGAADMNHLTVANLIALGTYLRNALKAAA